MEIDLTPPQMRFLRRCANGGCNVWSNADRRVAGNLEDKGMVTHGGAGVMHRGVDYRLTVAGRAALSAWDEANGSGG